MYINPLIRILLQRDSTIENTVASEHEDVNKKFCLDCLRQSLTLNYACPEI